MRAQVSGHYWQVRELVTIGVFTALIKVSSILVTLVGGGMNPLTLVFKNLIFTTLLVVLMFKVRKPGTLLLFTVVSILMSMLLMGGGFFLLPAMVLSGLIAEALIVGLGGYERGWTVLVGVACYDLLFKLSALGISWIFVREQPGMLWMSAVFVVIGYVGAIAGLPIGSRFVRELRHAGIVHR